MGHPEHELLFIATQVARAAGLKNPSQSVAQAGDNREGVRVRVSDIESLHDVCRDGHMVKANSWLFNEARCFNMLLRGYAPQSAPFRKWVTEIVLPSIRKTGAYNVNEAQDATSIQFAGELAGLHSALAS